ncbi:DUF2808 domain-containing protein [Prochlorococcus sp. MIT 1223]|uniref:DUF2808 domain-containing protein n=1 Tax=Prochlorococcus sp. MIT 1223 TaxID=3096217 RepID=UPI002A75B5F5|nr:DUF2808 domain-containing protein [Prochlorococcus sp. MIT 1223]
MLSIKKILRRKNILKVGIAAGLLVSCFYFEAINKQEAAIASGMAEFRWGGNDNYKPLKFLQRGDERLERATYFFFLKKNQRKTAILKLSLKFPEHFKARIKPKNIRVCQVRVGGFTEKSKCLKNVPATIEIDKQMKNIDIFPDTPIPANNKAYAVVLKIFNPRKSGMYQINAFSQSPGELPVSLYLGSYVITIK